MKTTFVLLIALAAGTAFGQYPYYPPAYGYMNRNEALAQQAFENQLRWQAEQRAQWNYWFPDPIEFGRKATELRLLKEQERSLRMDNDRQSSGGGGVGGEGRGVGEGGGGAGNAGPNGFPPFAADGRPLQGQGNGSQEMSTEDRIRMLRRQWRLNTNTQTLQNWTN